MTERPLRLAVACPVCETPPAKRVSRRSVDEKATWPPDEVVENVQCMECMKRRRITYYDITAAAYQKAS